MASELVNLPVHNMYAYCPDFDTQKAEIHLLLQTQLKKGDIWCLVDVRWWKQWKKYVGYDQWDQSQHGLEEAHPGPVDNTNLFNKKKPIKDPLPVVGLGEKIPMTFDEVSLFELVNRSDQVLREHLMEELDYFLLPAQAWNKLVEWYGMTAGSRPVSRVVVEYAWLYMKHLKVEVYPLEFRLCVHPLLSNIIKLKFSRAHTVGCMERVMRATFSISEETECRVWHRYMTDTFELLSEPKQTLQDAGLYNGQLIILEKRSADGSWPRSQTRQQPQEQQTPPLPKTFNETMQTLRGLDPQSTRPSAKYRQTTASLQRTNGELNRSVPEAQRQLTEPRQEATAVQGQLTKVQGQLTEVQDQLIEARQEANQAQSQLAEARREASQTQSQLTEVRQEATVVERQLAEARGQLTEARQEANQAQHQLAEARREANQAQHQLAEARQEANQTQNQLAAACREASQTQSQLTEVRQEATVVERQLAEARGQLTEARQEANQAQHQLAEARREVSQMRSQLTEAHQEANQTQCQLAEAQRQAEEAHQRADGIEHDLRDAEHRLTTSDRVFQDVLQRIMGHIPQSQPFWVVQRAEVTLTDEEIGTGGWASVKVAIFRGQRVAAKCLHQQIVSAHNVRLFTREMNMAAQARHPNLLQFVGAVMEGTPIILTELLPTSLRRIMEQGTRLTQQQIVLISCDVARALNYLHLSTPDPIVHRDLSSANVLLDLYYVGIDGWRAKVSDYGSANFVRYATTAGPGNPLYGAPEANDPSRHSPKMDVFSFGVMLVEMVAGELPDNREELIRTHMHDWPDMVRIVRACTRHEPQRRPTMNELITDLSGLNVE